jgi:hypothetical protein
MFQAHKMLVGFMVCVLASAAQAGPRALRKAGGKTRVSLGTTTRLAKLAAKIVTAQKAVASLQADLGKAEMESERYRLQLQLLHKKAALKEALAERELRRRTGETLSPALKKQLLARKLAVRREIARARVELARAHRKAARADRAGATLELLDARAELSRMTEELKIVREHRGRLHNREYRRKLLAVQIRVARDHRSAIKKVIAETKSTQDRLEYEIRLSEVEVNLRLDRNQFAFLTGK